MLFGGVALVCRLFRSPWVSDILALAKADLHSENKKNNFLRRNYFDELIIVKISCCNLALIEVVVISDYVVQ